MLYLILFSFLSPVIYGILKQKWIGLMVIFAVLILNFSAMLTPYLPINVNDVFSWSIYYLIGSYLGIHWKDAVTSKNPYIPALIFLVGSCISFIFTFVHIQTGWIVYLQNVWCCVSLVLDLYAPFAGSPNMDEKHVSYLCRTPNYGVVPE